MKRSKRKCIFLQLIVETNLKEFEREGYDLFNEAIELKKNLLLLKNQNNLFEYCNLFGICYL